MLHEIDDLRQERQRTEARPSPQGAPPVLTVFDVTPAVDPQDYIHRVRATLSAALTITITESFENEDLPTERIPEWFAAVSGTTGSEIPEFSHRGMDRYHTAVNEKSWDLQWWLFEFDPDNEFRGWAWWDITQTRDRQVRVWADSWGESFFACDELRWLLYTAGADEVSGPFLADTSEWTQEITGQ
ncbi:hypothetical protein ACFC0M_06485 [Streptomyces sp. NPDC056149]|uniref:hypothetical protein n=1 Tax=Streptomyces sp. NPDC056149 TaxID=3345728 RepID=UPI0035DB7B28